jgi:hypothetical protein
MGDALAKFVESHPKAEDTKRSQVSQACSHCRQKHIACDQKRPCERCVVAKIDCVDVPRKKRTKKQEVIVPEFEKTAAPQTVQSAPVPRKNENIHHTAEQSNPNRWEDAMFTELFAPQPQSFQDFGMADHINDARNFTVATEFPSPSSDGKQDSSPNGESSASDSSDSTPHLPKEVFDYLTKQISDLQQSNQVLTHRLKEVADQLDSIKTQQKLIHPTSQGKDLAISLWVVDPQTSDKYLVECNDQFVSLLGIPLNTLKNRFTTKDLIHKIFPGESKDGKAHRRTIINTSSGHSEVYMSVTPVCDQQKKLIYHIVHILAGPPAASSSTPQRPTTTPLDVPANPPSVPNFEDSEEPQDASYYLYNTEANDNDNSM